MSYSYAMTLGAFREQTKDLPDDTKIVVDASDHSYSGGRVHDTHALVKDNGHMTEWFEDREPCDEERKCWGEKKPVVLVSGR